MFYEPLKVRLVNVHVVATDSNGVPIRGLTESDFEIFEDGQPVEISHFLAADSQAGGVVDNEERTALDEALQPNVHMALYFDDYNVNPRHRTSVLNHLRGFLYKPLPEGVKVILVRFDGRIHIESDFSDDRDQLLAALDRIQSQSPIDLTREGEILVRRMQNAAPKAHITVGGSGSANVDSGSRNGDPAGMMAVMQADFMPELHAYAGAKFIRNRSSAKALTTFVRYMQGIPGRKAVLWVGGLETRVGENLFRTYVELFPTHAKSQSLNPMMDSLQYDITQNLRTLVQYANSHRVSFYTLGSLGAGTTSGFEFDARTFESSGRPGTVGHLDRRGETEALAMISVLTGGRMLADNADLEEQLEQITGELRSYYSLGYRPPNAPDTEYHSISVNVLREGVKLRHRQGYRATEKRDQMTGRTLTAVMLGVADNPLGISVECQEQESRGKGEYLVPVMIQIPIGELVLQPAADRHVAQISVASVVRDDKGRMSDVHEREYPIEIANDQLLYAVGQRAEFVIGMVLREGPHRISISVRDEQSSIESTEYVDVEVGNVTGETGR